MSLSYRFSPSFSCLFYKIETIVGYVVWNHFYKSKTVKPKYPDPGFQHHSLIRGNRILEECLILRAGQEIYEMSVEHLKEPGSKEVLKTQNGGNMPRAAGAKAGTVRART